MDRSSSAYKGRRLVCFLESHPRQWVDRSSPAYTRELPDLSLDCAPFLRQQVKLQFLKERSDCGDISKDFHTRL